MPKKFRFYYFIFCVKSDINFIFLHRFKCRKILSIPSLRNHNYRTNYHPSFIFDKRYTCSVKLLVSIVMKKRLEAELISIAHRVLKLKNKSDVDQLYKESKKLYETLAVLKFYEDNFELVKNELPAAELEEKLETAFNKPQAAVFEKPIEVELNPIVQAVEEKNVIVGEITVDDDDDEVEDESFEDNDLVAEEDHEDHELNGAEIEEQSFEPMFELELETPSKEPIEPIKDETPKQESKPVTLDNLLGDDYKETVFVKPNEVSLFSNITTESTNKEPKVLNLNDSFSKNIEVGLNDRVAFVKHLFGESNEDYNRVMSQLNTFATLEEVKNFLNEMVIPDYGYWVGKEEYIERFMEVIEKKFS